MLSHLCLVESNPIPVASSHIHVKIQCKSKQHFMSFEQGENSQRSKHISLNETDKPDVNNM